MMETERTVRPRICNAHKKCATLIIFCTGIALTLYILFLATSPNTNVATTVPTTVLHVAVPTTVLHDVAVPRKSVLGHETQNDESMGRKTVKKFRSNRPCTFGLFREVNIHDHYFPSGGKWVNNTVGDSEHYQPNACKFKYETLPTQFMDRCLAKANLRSVLTMGDSTAGKYSKAVMKVTGGICDGVKHEHYKTNTSFIPDYKYYTSQLSDRIRELVSVKFRFCSGCSSHVNMCQNNGSSSIRYEHLAQTMILDDSLQIEFPNYRNASGVLDKIWALTSQEFMFRYFLNNTYPQVFLIFLPFVHAKQNMKLDRLAIEIQYFKNLVEYYFPKNTKLIYMPAYSEFAKKPDNTMWRGRLFEGMLAQEKIAKMNDVLYDVLEPDLLKDNGRIFSFLDVFEASVSRATWSNDGIHMQAVWYENVMTMFWETFCNSVMMDDF